MEFVAKRRTLNVSIDDQKYPVKYPTLGELHDYRTALKEKGVDGEKLLTNFLTSLGLPEDAQRLLERPDYELVIDLLTDQKKA